MEEIIRYITEDFIKNLINLQREFYRAPESLADFVLNTRKATDELGRRFVQAMVQEINDQIRTMAVRKRNWVVERKGDPKTLTTSIGDILFFKTLYTSKFSIKVNALAAKGTRQFRFCVYYAGFRRDF